MSKLPGGVFVTPHAVHRFQQRIKSLPFNDALAAIVHSVSDTSGTVRPLQNGSGVMVRTKAPWRLRLMIANPNLYGPFPAVVSVMRG